MFVACSSSLLEKRKAGRARRRVVLRCKARKVTQSYHARASVNGLMVFDVAIANYNTASHLFALLRSIEEHIPRDAMGTVHVWDNGSIDRSLNLLRALAPSRSWLHVHACKQNVQHGPA